MPVSLGLIIDNSGSMRDKRAKVEAAALALVNDSNPDDEVFVVNFNDEPFLDLPNGRTSPTTSRKWKRRSRASIPRRHRHAGRHPHVHRPPEGEGHKDKKVLVVVTDGNDNASMISLEKLVKAAQQSEF